MAPVVGLIFHGVGMPRRGLEPGEAPYWLSEATFLSVLDQIAALPNPDRIRLSFDDGNLSDYDVALQALLERGLRADFFVLTGRLNQPGSLTEGHIRVLHEAGMGVGSHGINHLDWTRLDPTTLRHELEDSRRVLEYLLDTPVREAAIPFGAWNGRVLRTLRQAGYTKAYSSDCGPMDTTAFLRPRTSITTVTGMDNIVNILSGKMTPLSRLRRKLTMTLKQWRDI